MAKRISLFPNLIDLSGWGKSVELKQTKKQQQGIRYHIMVRHARGSQAYCR